MDCFIFLIKYPLCRRFGNYQTLLNTKLKNNSHTLLYSIFLYFSILSYLCLCSYNVCIYHLSVISYTHTQPCIYHAFLSGVYRFWSSCQLIFPTAVAQESNMSFKLPAVMLILFCSWCYNKMHTAWEIYKYSKCISHGYGDLTSQRSRLQMIWCFIKTWSLFPGWFLVAASSHGWWRKEMSAVSACGRRARKANGLS